MPDLSRVQNTQAVADGSAVGVSLTPMARQAMLTRRFAAVVFGLGVVFTPINTVVFFTRPDRYSFSQVTLALTITLLGGIPLLLLRANRVNVAAALFSIGLFGIVVSAIYSTGFESVMPAALIAPLIVVALLFDQRAMIFSTGVSFVGLAACYASTAVFGWWQPIASFSTMPGGGWYNVLTCTIIIGISLALLNIFVRERAAAQASMVEATELRQLLAQLSERSRANQQASNAMNHLAIDLVNTAQQQFGGSTEQVAAVVQVTTSMEELTETARQIATNTTDVSTAATHALDSATHVQSATERAEHVGVSGRRAVDAAIFGIETVRDKIENLATKLLLLAERSQQISAIIGLITAIADETHLLSLNAAIESAGAGENGARFAVIANEVKGLADRSLEATRDVRSVIADVQAAIAAAVLAAEEGKKETVGAVELAYQAGEVIGDLGGVITTASDGAHTIVGAVATVVQLAEEIALATRQQQSASDQVVLTLRSIGQVAREVASGNSTITQAVASLQHLSADLVLVEIVV